MFGLAGVFGKIFGTEKALTGIVDAATRGLDALVYTDEEKANDAAEERKRARSAVIDWMNATQGQNVARRVIALCITAVWLFMYLLSVFCNMTALFLSTENAQVAIQVGGIAKDSALDMNGAVMLILAFYFAAPHMGAIVETALSSFGNRTGTSGTAVPKG